MNIHLSAYKMEVMGLPKIHFFAVSTTMVVVVDDVHGLEQKNGHSNPVFLAFYSQPTESLYFYSYSVGRKTLIG